MSENIYMKRKKPFKRSEIFDYFFKELQYVISRLCRLRDISNQLKAIFSEEEKEKNEK